MDRVNKCLDKLLKMFETGDLPPAVARTVIEEAPYDKPSNKWSLANRVIMLLHGTNDARGYRQWEQVGRHVKKGAKAFYILAPVLKKVKRTEEIQEVDPETGEVRTVTREVEREVLVGFKEVPVFRYEDTEGKPLPVPDYRPRILPPLAEVAARYGVKVEYSPFTARFYGYYRPAENRIMLCSHDVDIFFHELAHAVHATVRPLTPGQDPEQEIVAETVAAVLCEMYGYRGYAWHAYDYIRGYTGGKAGQELVKAIMRVLADVEKVLEKILQKNDKKQAAGM